jgi:RimJ/RimL family protein N-acetyltransferase
MTVVHNARRACFSHGYRPRETDTESPRSARLSSCRRPACAAPGYRFSFIDNRSGEIIGSSRYHGHDPELSEIEIGWTFLSRAYWGGNYNGEIKQLMTAHAFRFVDTVVFWIGASNLRSRRAVVKIGAVQRQGVWSRTHGGRDTPYVVYEIRKR